MNLVNYKVTGMGQAYEAVRRLAEDQGVRVSGTELVGLVPADAIDRTADYFRHLEEFTEDSIIEHRLESC